MVHLEFEERQCRHLDLELEVCLLPHRVEAVVLDVLRLALVVRPGVVGVAANAHLLNKTKLRNVLFMHLPYMSWSDPLISHLCIFRRHSS